MASSTTSPGRTPLQTAAGLVGATFLAIGVLGFVPGITQNLGDIEFAGTHSDAKLLGIFEVSVLHNLVHVLFGIAGLWAARVASYAKPFLFGGGAVYLALWVYGLVVGHDSAANFVPFNTADNWLHFTLGAGMVAIGMALSRTPVAATVRADRPARAR
ncbi:MAG TPA: DUF4383 domain-containing protein [Acidimicrobiales bacterium]